MKRDRQHVGGGGSVSLVLHYVPFRVPDGDMLPNDVTAEVLAVEADPSSSCPRNYVSDFEALLEDRGDQMMLSDLKAHHPSWFTRTGDDNATTREEALDGAVNISQLTAVNLDSPTRFPSQSQSSSEDVTLQNGHLLLT